MIALMLALTIKMKLVFKVLLHPIYNQTETALPKVFFLQELPADQIAWRVWNGGQWGYDEAEKYVLSTQTWSPESKITTFL